MLFSPRANLTTFLADESLTFCAPSERSGSPTGLIVGSHGPSLESRDRDSNTTRWVVSYAGELAKASLKSE